MRISSGNSVPSSRRHLSTRLRMLVVGDASMPEPASASSAYPMTIENCGHTVTVDAPPQRAVSLNQGSTEILLSLGLADRMVGTATWTDPVRDNLAAANATVPRLADNKPSFEWSSTPNPTSCHASFGGTLGRGRCGRPRPVRPARGARRTCRPPTARARTTRASTPTATAPNR